MKTGSARTWVGRTLLVLASLALVLGACELGARLLLPPARLVVVEEPGSAAGSFGRLEARSEIDLALLQMHGPAGRRLRPNARAVSRSVFRGLDVEVVIETNSLGLRYDELGPKPADEFRVLVLGDSVTMGIEVHDGELFTRQAEQRAAGRAQRIRFVNAGIVSADLGPSFYHMLELLDPVDPDVVMIQLYLNDARDSGMFYVDVVPERLRWSRFLMWAVDSVDAWRQSSRVRVAGIEHDWDAWADEFVEHQRTVYGGDPESFLRFEAETRDRAATDYGLGWNPLAWAEIEKIMSAASDILTERQLPLVVMLAPVDLQVYGATIDRVPQQHFDAMCRRLDLTCLDLLPPLREHRQSTGDPVLYDQCHLTPIGHAVTAASLVSFLDGHGMLPR